MKFVPSYKEALKRKNQFLNSGDLEVTITDALRLLGETKESLGTVIEAAADALEITLTHFFHFYCLSDLIAFNLIHSIFTLLFEIYFHFGYTLFLSL